MSIEVKDGNGTLRTMNTVVENDVHTPIHNPQGEILEALQAMRMAIEVMSRSFSTFYPDTAGRLRVLIDSTSSNLNTVNGVTTLSNQTSMGGFAANQQVPALINMNANDLRRNISVT